MSTAGGSRVSEMLPDAAWTEIANDTKAVLVDVRTKAEWGFVGIPDLSELGRSPILVEWLQFPEMTPNTNFVEQLMTHLDGEIPGQIFFLCRSGARSLSAAGAVAADLNGRGASVACVNVQEGFEGDLDSEKHRGGLNGWKARGLPWRQS